MKRVLSLFLVLIFPCLVLAEARNFEVYLGAGIGKSSYKLSDDSSTLTMGGGGTTAEIGFEVPIKNFGVKIAYEYGVFSYSTSNNEVSSMSRVIATTNLVKAGIFYGDFEVGGGTRQGNIKYEDLQELSEGTSEELTLKSVVIYTDYLLMKSRYWRSRIEAGYNRDAYAGYTATEMVLIFKVDFTPF